MGAAGLQSIITRTMFS